MILSNIKDLGKWSNVEIEVRCDECSVEKKLKFKLYTSYGYSDGAYLCKKCKLKKNNLEKWGVENVFQLDSVKQKSKMTNLEKRGVEFISQSDEIKEKVKKSISKLDKEKVNEKRKITTLNKLGVENVSQSEEIKNKKVKTNIENWGTENNKKSEKFRKIHFNISKHENYIEYVGNGISLFKCDNNLDHNFEIHIDNFIRRKEYKINLCSICNPISSNSSGLEIQLFKFIQSIYTNEIIQNFRIDRMEIDIYLPDLNLGFEFNGVYWHSSLYKEKNFHIDKSKFFMERGIRIIHIWEDDWINKTEIIKSQIKNLLGLSNRIGARKCKVVEITDVNVAKNFLNFNHIQGWVNSKIKLGLIFEDRLISIMTFDSFEGRKKMLENEYNLNRFCNLLDYSVIGGASKLLNYFVEKFNPKRIISYSDRDWSIGELYKKLEFEKVSESDADYKYVVEGKRIHKSNFKKSKTGVSESELEIPKIWDCGKIKWEKIYDFNERNRN